MWKAQKARFPRNIDGRPCLIASFGGASVQQQNQNQKTSAKERSSTVLRFASLLRSILPRAGAASRVEMNILRAPLTPLPSSARARAFLPVSRLHSPAAGYARHTLVSRDSLARREEERPFVVPFERF